MSSAAESAARLSHSFEMAGRIQEFAQMKGFTE
jgi:hypothetical protein